MILSGAPQARGGACRLNRGAHQFDIADLGGFASDTRDSTTGREDAEVSLKGPAGPARDSNGRHSVRFTELCDCLSLRMTG
jgi:hypothetical protein